MVTILIMTSRTGSKRARFRYSARAVNAHDEVIARAFGSTRTIAARRVRAKLTR
jgi:hypothetical protein